MVDLIHLAKAALKNPGRDIAVHRKSGEAHPLSKTMRAALLLRERVTFGSKKEQELLDYLLDEADSFAVFPHYEPSYWKRFRASYLSCEKNLGAEEIETLIKSHSSFLKYLESKGMLQHCADSLLYANAKDIGEWAFINEIVEKEAGKEQYKELRKALEVYAEQHFEKRYSSRTLFGIDSTDIGQCGTVFTVMGKDNPEIVGISFYIGYGANQYYSIFENGEANAYPMMLMGSIVSFYVEQHPDSHMFPFKNPLGKDNRFSCLSIRHGVKAHCRLGRVLIESLIEDIYHACGVLDAAKGRAGEISQIEDGVCDVGFAMMRSPEGRLCADFEATPRNPRRFYQFEPSLLREIGEAFPAKIDFTPSKKKTDYLFSFFPFAMGEPFPFLGDRIVKSPFIALVYEKQSGLILAGVLVEQKEGISFYDSLRNAFAEKAPNLPLPRYLYAPNELSFSMAHYLFFDQLKEGAIKDIFPCTEEEASLLDSIAEEMENGLFGDPKLRQA